MDYFKPLEHLDIGDAELFLGLVDAHDEKGTEERLTAAQPIYPYPFGVSIEYGMGRTSVGDVDSIFTIARNVTSPRIST
jgi:hypothetical protein